MDVLTHTQMWRSRCEKWIS